MASEGYHEPPEYLHSATKDTHRAIQSLVEELEAITWYNQRIDATGDPELKEVLAHNRDEEKEHAAMLLEWLRRRDVPMDEHLRTYLFTQGSLSAIEEAAEAAELAGAPESTAHEAAEEPEAAPAPVAKPAAKAGEMRRTTVGNLMGKR